MVHRAEPLRIESPCLLGPGLAGDRLRKLDAPGPGRRSPELLELLSREAERPERVDERLLTLARGDQLVDPVEILRRSRPDAGRALVENQLVQVARAERRAQCDGRPVRVSEETRRLVDRVHERGRVLELPLDRVLTAIAAFAAAPAVDREDRKTIDQSRNEQIEAPVRARRPMEKHERRPFPASPIGDRRSVARLDVLDVARCRRHRADSRA